MILDKQLVFSDGQAVTANAYSTNSIDLGAAGLELGMGTPLYLEVWLDTAFDTSADTLTIELRDGTTAGGCTNKVMELLPAIATSALLAANVGLLVKVPLPEGMSISNVLKLHYAVSAGLTSGKLNAFITIG